VIEVLLQNRYNFDCMDDIICPLLFVSALVMTNRVYHYLNSIDISISLTFKIVCCLSILVVGIVGYMQIWDISFMGFVSEVVAHHRSK
jgi:hypothetical protein